MLRIWAVVIFIFLFHICCGLIPMGLTEGFEMEKRPDQEIRSRMHGTYPAGGADY
jgi:hypothetical protein